MVLLNFKIHEDFGCMRNRNSHYFEALTALYESVSNAVGIEEKRKIFKNFIQKYTAVSYVWQLWQLLVQFNFKPL